MKRAIFFLYGIFSYAFFLVVFLALIGFLGNFILPKTIDSGSTGATGQSIVINLSLIALFGLPHTIMARQSFKQWWKRFIPHEVERSTYVLQSTIFLALLMVVWQPLPQILWNVEGMIGRVFVWGLFWGGWAVVLVATFLINHFELFGLQQVFAQFQRHSLPEPEFKTPGLYKIVRHPLQFGLLMVSWITPEMSLGHALFAIGMTIYILIGLHFEEKDLVRQFGAQYREYRRSTPKLLPIKSRSLPVDDAPRKNFLAYHPNVISVRIFSQSAQYRKDS